jgi:butyryl-CoA dehydrogenase
MNFQLNDEQNATQRMTRELAEKEIAPIAAQIDKEGDIPATVLQKIAQAGLFGIITTPEYEGAGGEPLDLVLAAEAISTASASVGWAYVSTVCISDVIQSLGTEEQKKKYLPPLASGEKQGAYGLSEPDSGTNWIRLPNHTRAVADGDDFVITGNKLFTSNNEVADIYLVNTRTSDTGNPLQDFTFFIVEKGTPSFSFGTRDDKFGMRGDLTGELVLDKCRVPKENALNGVGGGFGVFRAFGFLNCVGQAGVCLGIAQAAFDAAVRFVKERPISDSQMVANLANVQVDVAEMAVAIEAARLVTYKTALSTRRPEPFAFLSAMRANDVAVDVTDKAFELHGGGGSTSDFPVERYLRDAKTLSLQKTRANIMTTAGKMVLGV